MVRLVFARKGKVCPALFMSKRRRPFFIALIADQPAIQNNIMVVTTLVEFQDDMTKQIRHYLTKRFTKETKEENINQWILNKLKRNGYHAAVSDVQICVGTNLYVTLDQDYIEEFEPFKDEETESTTEESVIEQRRNLRVTYQHETGERSFFFFCDHLFLVYRTPSFCGPRSITYCRHE